MRRRFKLALAVLILILFSGMSEALIRYGSINGKPGLSFGGLQYNLRTLNVTISNRTKYNVNFGQSHSEGRIIERED